MSEFVKGIGQTGSVGGKGGVGGWGRRNAGVGGWGRRNLAPLSLHTPPSPHSPLLTQADYYSLLVFPH
ncbi:MAG: hypothetical protein V7K47_24395 [Nostoc sp.]